VAPILNRITRNTVEHCGRIRYYGGGVHLDSRPFNMSMAPGNYIAHNHFNDLSRNGIFAFRNQGGNVVEYNHIHNAMQTTIDGACIHFATMNHLNAPNFILNNWLHDIWGFDQRPGGTPVRKLANGVFLDWDTSNTTVKDNWVYNSGGTPVKVIWNNWNVVTSGNQSSGTPITPPFVAELGPDGTATNGIGLSTNKLTGSVIHYTDGARFATTGTWTPDSAAGLSGLFVFKFLVGTAAQPAEAVYTLPITENGTYQISMLYKPGGDRASNVPITIAHADGTAKVSWNMREGSNHGFAVEVGSYRFEAAGTNTVTLSTTGTNGKVIADAVAFVKIEDNEAPEAANVQVDGGALTGGYDYSDADNDLQGASRFKCRLSEMLLVPGTHEDPEVHAPSRGRDLDVILRNQAAPLLQLRKDVVPALPDVADSVPGGLLRSRWVGGLPDPVEPVRGEFPGVLDRDVVAGAHDRRAEVKPASEVGRPLGLVGGIRHALKPKLDDVLAAEPEGGSHLDGVHHLEGKRRGNAAAAGNAMPDPEDLVGSRLQQADIERRGLGSDDLGADQVLRGGGDLNLDRVVVSVEVRGGLITRGGEVPGEIQPHGVRLVRGRRISADGDFLGPRANQREQGGEQGKDQFHAHQ
jgi:hypothetical protein